MEWVLAGIAFLACWPTSFILGLALDEDVNHWTWPTDDGPGAIVVTKIALASGFGALLAGALVWAVARAFL